MSTDGIKCRGKVSGHCYAGEKLPEWREDATYDEQTDSIVCDACYVLVINASPSGMGLLPEIEQTLRRIRGSRRQAA